MNTRTIKKLSTHIAGFDHVACGGLPHGRTTLVTRTSGSGKTVFGAQLQRLKDDVAELEREIHENNTVLTPVLNPPLCGL